jgi:hypothetical protein
MDLLKKIFTDEGTAYVGLCKFKIAKEPVHIGINNVRFSTPREFYQTDFSKNVLL